MRIGTLKLSAESLTPIESSTRGQWHGFIVLGIFPAPSSSTAMLRAAPLARIPW